jgi:hypothetical protein
VFEKKVSYVQKSLIIRPEMIQDLHASYVELMTVMIIFIDGRRKKMKSQRVHTSRGLGCTHPNGFIALSFWVFE